MSDTKMCPYCGEDIKIEAIKCKHCQSMLSKEDDQLVGAAVRPAVPKIKKPLWQQWWAWVAAFVVLFIVLIASLGGNDTSTTSPGSQQQTPSASTTSTTQTTEPVTTEEPAAEIKILSIGDTTTFADWEYKVIDVEYHNTLKDYRARGVYIVFIVEVVNNSNVPQKVGRTFSHVVDDQGRLFELDTSASLAHHQTYRRDMWYLDDIGPSFSGIVPLAYDIPTDAKRAIFVPGDFREEDYATTGAVVVDINR
jgi:hypothetical protein